MVAHSNAAKERNKELMLLLSHHMKSTMKSAISYPFLHSKRRSRGVTVHNPFNTLPALSLI